MGYQTDFVGHLKIHPPLSATEAAIVNRISGSLLVAGGSVGLGVADPVESLLGDLREGAPPGWSNWVVAQCGDCLSYDGGDKANHMIPWLRFLIGNVLGPGEDGGRASPELTRDHLVNGIVVGSRRDTGELFAIVVRDNEVEIELMWEGDPEWSAYPRLGYQVEIDRFRAWVRADRRGMARP